MTEQEVILRVRGGETEAFGELIDAYVRRLRTHIALRAPFPQLIDEIAHETFVHAFRTIAQFHGGSFGAWLTAIADNLLRAELQRLRREQAAQVRYTERCLFEGTAQTAEQAAHPHLFEHLRLCLERLPPLMRQLIGLRYEMRCSATEVAGKMARSIPWVRTSLFRVRRQLKDCIDARSVSEKRR